MKKSLKTTNSQFLSSLYAGHIRIGKVCVKKMKTFEFCFTEIDSIACFCLQFSNSVKKVLVTLTINSVIVQFTKMRKNCSP